MKTKVVSFLRKTLGVGGVKHIRKLLNKFRLIENYYYDYKLYKKHSSLFGINSFENFESEVTLRYHSLEKGFAHNKVRFRFGRKRVLELLDMLSNIDFKNPNNNIQIYSAAYNLCYYFELHEKSNIDISDYFTQADYDRASSVFNSSEKNLLNGFKQHSRESYFLDVETKSFPDFSESRCSVRDFSGEKIKTEIIKKAIQLANNAPSVCNRQPNHVILINEKNKIDRILKLQGGLTGYTDNINQLLVLVTDRRLFYSVGERNQYYIDGGIYLMNLLYALHFYRIVACPAHWAWTRKKDLKIVKLLNISDAYKVICIVPIGLAKKNFKTTLSFRKNGNQTLTILN